MKTFFRHSFSVHQIHLDLLQYFKSFSFTLRFKVVGLNPVPTLKVFSIWKLVPNTVALMISSYEVATMQCCTLICWSILGFMHTQIVWSRARWDLKTTKSPDHLSILVIGWDGCRPRMYSGSPFFQCFYWPEPDGCPEEKSQRQSSGQGWEDEVLGRVHS